MSTPAALAPLPLARAAVDRAGHERAGPRLLARLWADPATAVLWLREGVAPVRQDALVLTAPAGPAPARLSFLGRLPAPTTPAARASDGPGSGPASGDPAPEAHVPDTPGRAVVLAVLPAASDPLPEGLAGLGDAAWLGLREAAPVLADADAALLVEALALVHWHDSHRYCGRCGGGTDVEAAGWVRRCRSCGAQHFPRTDPAVIVAVVDDADRILLGSNAAWPPGRHSCLAGFVDPGESLEHAVVREVHEESGVRVSAPAYRGSQPWPFPRSLMVGFRARALPDQSVTPDGVEIRSVRWFSRAELAAALEAGEITLPGPVSIARALIEDWYGGMLPDAPTPNS